MVPKIHRDLDGNILNLVFAWAEDGSELKVEVPIVYTGEDACPGVKKGLYSILFCFTVSSFSLELAIEDY